MDAIDIFVLVRVIVISSYLSLYRISRQKSSSNLRFHLPRRAAAILRRYFPPRKDSGTWHVGLRSARISSSRCRTAGLASGSGKM